MPCYTPMRAWLSRLVNESGKRSLVWKMQDALEPDNPMNIACGQCVGCRLERSRQWAVRCVHEASLYENNCFITLTFNEIELNKRENPLSLDVKDFQLFMKKLRNRFGAGIRFFHCGEYGDLKKRPHYHACLFNFDFPDKELWKVTETGARLYISKSLSELWPYGFSTIGDVTFESAAYCARYIMKKVTGDKAPEHYTFINESEGVVYTRKPEYTTMSRRPGIGKEWFDKFKDDVYPDDFVIMNGKKVRPPKFYDRQLEQFFPEQFDDIKEERVKNGNKHYENNIRERLDARLECKESQLSTLKRNLDHES